MTITELNAADYELLAQPNSNGRLRTIPPSIKLNSTTGIGVVTGLRGHWHPTRIRPIDCIVIHTGENLPDWDDWTDGRGDEGADSVMSYMKRMERAASYHAVCDADSRHQALPDSFTAFHCSGWNSRSLGLSFATRAHRWTEAPQAWLDAIIENGAIIAAAWCVLHNIKPERVNRNAMHAGATGILTHAELDPTRRSDPGPDFPWDLFLQRVRAHVFTARPAHPEPNLAQPMTFVDYAPQRPADGDGSWWLVDDGGIANLGGAPYCGHLLDPRTQAILQQALGTAEPITYDGKPVAIRPNEFGGYTIWTDQGRSYMFHPGTV